MFGSDVLDVAIGVTVLFLFASLVCSALQEAIESAMRWRAMDLERGIREILQTEYEARKSGDPAAAQRTWAQAFYDHPFIYALYSGGYDAARVVRGGLLSGAPGHPIMPRAARASLPTYIPSGNFAATLIDLVRLEAGPDAPLTFASLEAGARAIPNPRLSTAVLAAVLGAQGDLDRLRVTFERWFDGTMDRVSGWYRRRTQATLLLIGLLTAAVFNIDAVQVARHLANDRAYRETVVAEARATDGARRAAAAGTASSPAPSPAADGSPAPANPAAAPPVSATFAQARADLDANGFILGWPSPQRAEATRRGRSTAAATLFMVFGWLVTALAVSLGAPFWFDVLNKFMVVRSTVKPAEKSGREGSKDSAPPPAPPRPDPAPAVVAAPPPADPVQPAA